MRYGDLDACCMWLKKPPSLCSNLGLRFVTVELSCHSGAVKASLMPDSRHARNLEGQMMSDGGWDSVISLKLGSSREIPRIMPLTAILPFTPSLPREIPTLILKPASASQVFRGNI
jgi:hypothetical protein